MALVFEGQNHNFRPPLRHRHCRLRSLSIQANLSDFDNENPRKHLKLSDANNENPKKHIKRLSDFGNGHPKKNGPNMDPLSFRSLFNTHRSFPKSLSTPCLLTQFTVQTLKKSQTAICPSIELISTSKPPGTNELIAEATIAIKLGLHPVENQGERSQAFELKNDNQSVAIIKPMDCLESAAREIAAFILDHKGFSGVTPSAIVKISHPDLNKANVLSASLQRYIPHVSDARAMGPSKFSVGAVHRIGILDVRLLNIDRHTGNILVRKKTNASNPIADSVYDLLPIDHELCLPEELEDPYFEWLHWKQASLPFSNSEKDYVASLAPFKDADLLRSELPQIKEAAIRVFILCSIFLKEAVLAGLCLADIGDMMTAEFDKQSVLESLCRRAAGLLCIEKSIDEANDTQHEDEMQETQFEMDVTDLSFITDKTKVFDGLAKAMSLPDTDFNYARNKVSFAMLCEEEWLKFLERFEEILPPSFEARKNMRLKRKLGISCKF